MRQAEYGQATPASPPATARRLRLVQPNEVPAARAEPDCAYAEAQLDYDELAQALLRQVMRCLQA